MYFRWNFDDLLRIAIENVQLQNFSQIAAAKSRFSFTLDLTIYFILIETLKI